jgi:hypothetical protein
MDSPELIILTNDSAVKEWVKLGKKLEPSNLSPNLKGLERQREAREAKVLVRKVGVRKSDPLKGIDVEKLAKALEIIKKYEEEKLNVGK